MEQLGRIKHPPRNQEFSIGTAPLIILWRNARNKYCASIYRAGTRISFSGTQVMIGATMATHAWYGCSRLAYVISAGKRWATEGFEGTSFDGNSFSLVSKKKINDQHSLNISGFYTRVAEENSTPNTS
jgi:hypothetical protein